MKSKIAILSLAMASYASAVDIYITGATAFRTAAVKTICAAYASQGAFLAGYNSGTLTGASQASFSGNYPGIGAGTRIFCSWNGSVEGIGAIHNGTNVSFLTGTLTTAGAADGTGGSAITGTTNLPAQLAFSDVSQASTPFTSNTLFPADPRVGVVAFSWVVNNGGNAGITGITSQLGGAMLQNGFQPLSLFTGVATDTSLVYLTGRNDGSGTRTTVFAEVGFGISGLTQQWKPTVASGAITELRLWPTADNANASTIWNQDTAGNGGFSSGGNLTTSMRATSSAVQRKAANGANSGSPVALSLIGYQSAADAFATQAAGTPGRLLKYNGADALTFATDGTGQNVLSPASVNAIATGRYTLWGYEVLYSNVDLDEPANASVKAVYDSIVAGANATNLGLSGVPLSAMLVNRSQDGGTVAP